MPSTVIVSSSAKFKTDGKCLVVMTETVWKQETLVMVILAVMTRVQQGSRSKDQRC